MWIWIQIVIFVGLTEFVFADHADIQVVERPTIEIGNDYYIGNRSPLEPSMFIVLPPGAVKPQGWLNKQLWLQAEGFHGRLAEISPYLRKNGNAWLDENGRGSHGWEEVPYWLKGYGNLAYILGDESMIAEAKTWIEGAIKSQQDDGWFGPDYSKPDSDDSLKGRDDLWPNMIMLFCLQDYYDFSGDTRVPAMMTRYFRYLHEKVPPDRLLNGYWPVMRGGDLLYSVYWLYNRTGDSWLLDLAKKVHADTARWDEKIVDWHNVNFAQGFGEPATYYLQSHNKKDLDAAYRNFHEIRKLFGQVPGGMFGADENARKGYSGPRQCIETCGIVEQMLSDETLLCITGDSFWADHCETVAFNTFPAALTPDLKSLRYLTAPNLVLSDDVEKRPAVQIHSPVFLYSAQKHRCCQHNWGQGWPYFVRHLWLATPGNGLAAGMYGPSKVTAKVGNGHTVSIVETTNYPFDESISLKIEAENDVRFPLYLRVPEWCSKPSMTLNGKPVVHKAETGDYVVIERTWSGGDEVKITFPMELRVKTWAENKGSVSVMRGPLTYSLKIGEEFIRKGEIKEWPEWEIHPFTPWNYGLVLDKKDPAASFEVIKKKWPSSDMPFTQEGAPLEIKAQAQKIPYWKLEPPGMVGRIPESPVASVEPVETVTLIPMGAARLRVSAFPVVVSVPCYDGEESGQINLDALKEWRSRTRDERSAWWTQDRFGMFIHWGIYSVPAGIYKDKVIPGTGEWIMSHGKIPVKEYKEFAKRFNPEKYNPDAWVRLAKDAGMGYIVITAKHHDGFALFDSSVTDWDVVDATPYGRDLLQPLAEACRRHDMKLGFYYSQAQDWCHPGGAGGGWDPAQKGDMDTYLKEIAVPQLHEILTNYGQLGILWWDTPYNMNNDRANKVWPVLRYQPHLITNDRLGQWCEGDFETPEQGIPGGEKKSKWETCMTINSTWGYQSHDQDWKSSDELIRNLVNIASKGGNYLLNVGPDSDGVIPEACEERLHEIGKWMQVNAEAIYGTEAGPFGDLPFGRSTLKTAEHALYLHVFDWPEDGWINLPGLHTPVLSAVCLSAPDVPLDVRVTQPGTVRIKVPGNAPTPPASVVKLRYEGTLKADRFVPRIRPSKDGLIKLSGAEARTTGPLLYVVDAGCLQYWVGKDSAEWVVETDDTATYRVEVVLSCDGGQHGTPFRVQVGETELKGTVPDTGGREHFEKLLLGDVAIPKNKSRVSIEPLRKPNGTLMNLRCILLKRINE